MYEWVEVFGKEGRVAKRQREKMGGRKRERERDHTFGRGRAIVVARETVQHESDSTRGGLCAAVPPCKTSQRCLTRG